MRIWQSMVRVVAQRHVVVRPPTCLPNAAVCTNCR